MNLSIVNNTARSRFETEINGEFAFIDYRFHKGDIVLMHTFVPEEDRNHGVAFALARFALEYIKREKMKMIVYCPTVAKYISLHPEYEQFIDEQYQHLQKK